MSRTDDDRYYIKEMERLEGENAELKAGLREPSLGASAAENGCQGKYLAMILDNSKDIIAITDRGGRIMCCTEELLRLAGIQSCALIRGRNFSEIFEPYMPGASDGTSWERVVENVAANKTGAQLSLTLDIGGRGTPRSYMVHVTPMLEGGEIDGFMILASDATELIHAKKMAEQASEAKSNFLAQMSHGIRTPMNAIIGMTELMRTDNFDAIQLEYLESINKMSRSVLQIINDILDFSKAEAGRMKLVPADFDITVLYDSMCSIMELAAAEKSLEFKCSFGEGLPRVLYGDELRTRQILTNVLNNAVKYTNEGFVSFTVEKRTRHLRDHIVFVVRDSGIGIKKEDFSKLFDSFEQLDSARERAIIGTGLGLAITKKLVALMEGFIELESEYGRGSAFTVWIPLTEGDASKTETTADLERVVAAGGAEVLVVDDNKINQTVALGFLARHNIFADTAENGIEAIEMITKKRYDLVFMDHMMPLMDGVETTRRVRSFGGEYYGIVPIIALSANAVAGTREMFREAGMNDFISKPIESAALNRVLLTWLPAGKKISAVQSEFPREEEGDGWKIFDSRSAIIDVEAAKSRYVSAEEYLGVLRTFAVYTPTLLERIRVPSLGELQDYSITVHGIKGSSYGICADAIGRMAEALEASAKRGDFNAVEAGNAGFISMTERLLAELNAVLSAKSAMTKPRKTSPDETSLAAILKSCEEYDSSGMENALQKLEQFDYGANGEIVDWLRVQIDNIEYEAVKERLISLMKDS